MAVETYEQSTFVQYSMNRILDSFLSNNNNDNNPTPIQNDRTLSSINDIYAVYTNNSMLPGVIIGTVWFLYMISLSIWKLCRFGCPKDKCCVLGGTFRPEDFKIEGIEDDVITIIEEENVVLRGESYDKNRYDTLSSQMRLIRRVFFILGTIFVILSVPTTMYIIYYSFIFSTISSRVDTMKYRLDTLQNTMNLLEQNRADLITMSQDLITSLSSTSAESCFQTNILYQTLTNTLASMGSIELSEVDVFEIEESVGNASDLATLIRNNFSQFFVIIWVAILSVTFLNVLLLILMLGVKTARRGTCKSNHYRIYYLITFPLFVLFTTLLWFSVAGFSFGVIVNGNFCGEDDSNDPVLDILANSGFDQSAFYFFTETYVEGCTGGEELGATITSLNKNLRESINNANTLQGLMAAGSVCSSFSSLSQQIEGFNSNFEGMLPHLNSASYIMNCENIHNWNAELTSRATCTDLPYFAVRSFAFLLVLVIIVSVIIALNVALKSNVQLFLEMTSGDEDDSTDKDEQGDMKKSSRRLVLDGENQLYPGKTHELVQKDMKTYTVESYIAEKQMTMKPKKGTKTKRVDDENEAKIQKLKEELAFVFDTPAKKSNEEIVREQVEQQLNSRSRSPFRRSQLVDQMSPRETSISPVPNFSTKPNASRNRSPSPRRVVTLNPRERTASPIKNMIVPPRPVTIEFVKEENVLDNNVVTVQKAKEEVKQMFSTEEAPIIDVIKNEIKKQLNHQNDKQNIEVKSNQLTIKEEIEKQLGQRIPLSPRHSKTEEESMEKDLSPRKNIGDTPSSIQNSKDDFSDTKIMNSLSGSQSRQAKVEVGGDVKKSRFEQSKLEKRDNEIKKSTTQSTNGMESNHENVELNENNVVEDDKSNLIKADKNHKKNTNQFYPTEEYRKKQDREDHNEDKGPFSLSINNNSLNQGHHQESGGMSVDLTIGVAELQNHQNVGSYNYANDHLYHNLEDDMFDQRNYNNMSNQQIGQGDFEYYPDRPVMQNQESNEYDENMDKAVMNEYYEDEEFGDGNFETQVMNQQSMNDYNDIDDGAYMDQNDEYNEGVDNLGMNETNKFGDKGYETQSMNQHSMNEQNVANGINTRNYLNQAGEYNEEVDEPDITELNEVEEIDDTGYGTQSMNQHSMNEQNVANGINARNYLNQVDEYNGEADEPNISEFNEVEEIDNRNYVTKAKNEQSMNEDNGINARDYLNQADEYNGEVDEPNTTEFNEKVEEFGDTGYETQSMNQHSMNVANGTNGRSYLNQADEYNGEADEPDMHEYNEGTQIGRTRDRNRSHEYDETINQPVSNEYEYRNETGDRSNSHGQEIPWDEQIRNFPQEQDFNYGDQVANEIELGDPDKVLVGNKYSQNQSGLMSSNAYVEGVETEVEDTINDELAKSHQAAHSNLAIEDQESFMVEHTIDSGLAGQDRSPDIHESNPFFSQQHFHGRQISPNGAGLDLHPQKDERAIKMRGFSGMFNDRVDHNLQSGHQIMQQVGEEQVLDTIAGQGPIQYQQNDHVNIPNEEHIYATDPTFHNQNPYQGEQENIEGPLQSNQDIRNLPTPGISNMNQQNNFTELPIGTSPVKRALNGDLSTKIDGQTYVTSLPSKSLGTQRRTFDRDTQSYDTPLNTYENPGTFDTRTQTYDMTNAYTGTKSYDLTKTYDGREQSHDMTKTYDTDTYATRSSINSRDRRRDSEPFKLKLRLSESSGSTSRSSYSSRSRFRDDSTGTYSQSTRSYSTRSYSTRSFDDSTRASSAYDTSHSSYTDYTDDSSYTRSDGSFSGSSYDSRSRRSRKSRSRRSKSRKSRSRKSRRY